MLARGTSGFSGADLANLVNEAALNAARYNQRTVRMLDFEFAKDKVLMGAERRSMIISEAEKKVTAVHEAGHALLAVLLPHADPIHKVTIIPRGMALGVTMQLPEDDKHNYSSEHLHDMIAILLGGRIAEEITIGGITTGAGNDLERSTELARKMVCEWGMSDQMGPLTFGKKSRSSSAARSPSIRTTARTRRSASTTRSSGSSPRTTRARATPRSTAKNSTASPRSCCSASILDADQVRRIVNGESLDELKSRTVPATPAAPASLTTPGARSASGRRSFPRSRSRLRKNSFAYGSSAG